MKRNVVQLLALTVGVLGISLAEPTAGVDGANYSGTLASQTTEGPPAISPAFVDSFNSTEPVENASPAVENSTIANSLGAEVISMAIHEQPATQPNSTAEQLVTNLVNSTPESAAADHAGLNTTTTARRRRSSNRRAAAAGVVVQQASKCDKCNIPVANGGCKCNSNCDCVSPGSGGKCDKCNMPVANGGCKCDSNCDCVTSGVGGKCDKCNRPEAAGGCKCDANCDCVSGSGSKCDKCNLPQAAGGCKCDANCDCVSGGSCTGPNFPRPQYDNCQVCNSQQAFCVCRPGYCNPVPSASWAAGGAPMCVRMTVPCPIAPCVPGTYLATNANGNQFCDICQFGCARCTGPNTCQACMRGFIPIPDRNGNIVSCSAPPPPARPPQGPRCGDGTCTSGSESCFDCPRDCGECPPNQTEASKCTKRTYMVFPAWNACAAGYVNVAGVCWQRCDTVHAGFKAFADCGWASAAECAIDTNVCSQSPFSIVSSTLRPLVGDPSAGMGVTSMRFQPNGAVVSVITAVGNMVVGIVRLGLNVCPGP